MQYHSGRSLMISALIAQLLVALARANRIGEANGNYIIHRAMKFIECGLYQAEFLCGLQEDGRMLSLRVQNEEKKTDRHRSEDERIILKRLFIASFIKIEQPF